MLNPIRNYSFKQIYPQTTISSLQNKDFGRLFGKIPLRFIKNTDNLEAPEDTNDISSVVDASTFDFACCWTVPKDLHLYNTDVDIIE